MTSTGTSLIKLHVERLQKVLGYSFEDDGLLMTALTHASFAAEKNSQISDNQRLEFLGDSVIQLILTEELYLRFPEAKEGTLTKWRARLVSRDALSDFAQDLELGQFLQIGKGENASGGRNRKSTLSDCLEAVFGALYLDAGLEKTRKIFLKLIDSSFQTVIENPTEGNPKGELQEILQSLHPESPSYEILSSDGPDHSKNFVAAVQWCGKQLGKGEGSSKKSAEIAAAFHALQARVWENE